MKVRRGHREGDGTEECHDRASLSRPLVLSLGPLTSLTSFPLFCSSEDISGRGRGGASDKMGLEGKGTDLSRHFLTLFFPSPFWRPLLTFTEKLRLKMGFRSEVRT